MNDYIRSQASYPTQTRTFDLGAVFTFRVPYPIDSLTVESFTGTAGTLFLQIGTTERSRERIVVGKLWTWTSHQYPIYVINTTAQAGKTLRITFGGEGSSVTTPPISSVHLLTGAEAIVTDPATDTYVESLKGTGANKKTLYDIWLLLNTGITVTADIITADIESITGAGAAARTLGNIVTQIDLVTAKLNAQLDITQTAHANLLRGALTKDFSTLETDLESLNTNFQTQMDIAQSAMRDAMLAGTVAYPGGLDDIYNKLTAQLDITLTALANLLKGAGAKDFSTLETDVESLDAKVTIKDLDTGAGTDNRQVVGLLKADAGGATLISPATEDSLALVKAKTDNLDIALSALRDALEGVSDKNFTTLETDVETGNTTLASILAQLDITQTALANLLKGAGAKDFSTLETDVELVVTRLTSILAQLDITLTAQANLLKGASAKDFSTLETDVESLVTALGSRTSFYTKTIASVAIVAGGEQLTAQAVAPGKGIVLHTNPANSGTVWYATSGANVDADATRGTLYAGQGITLYEDNLNRIYVKGSAASQVLVITVET